MESIISGNRPFKWSKEGERRKKDERRKKEEGKKRRNEDGIEESRKRSKESMTETMKEKKPRIEELNAQETLNKLFFFVSWKLVLWHSAP